jgi:hypothetical protein
MVLENIDLSEDRPTAILIWWYILGFLSSVGYIRCQQCIFQPHVNFVHWTSKRLISVRNYMLCLISCVMNWIQYVSIY